MLKTIFSRWTLKDEVQGAISRLEHERVQHFLALIELDGKRGIIESKLNWLRKWQNPPPAPEIKTAEKSE